MDEALARFQREQLAHAISEKEEKRLSGGMQNYQAFTLIDKTEKTTRLQIRCTKELTHAPAYSCLLDVYYDGFQGTELTLLYSFMQVKIKGKNLQALTTAIEKHECAIIQNFDAQFFNPPKSNETIIAWIEVLIK
jgi:hypothetical protein